MADAQADCIAFGPHPDDIELGCSGTLAKMARAGRSVVLADLTRGELSTRGTVELREREAAEAARRQRSAQKNSSGMKAKIARRE